MMAAISESTTLYQRPSNLKRFFKDNRKWAPYLFVAPFFLTFAIFTLYPVLRAIIMGFQEIKGFAGGWEWVGAANFVEAVGDERVHIALRNAVVYAMGSILMQVPFAFLLAMMLANPRLRAKWFYRSVYFLPSILPGVTMAMLAIWFFNPERGLLNAIISAFGGERVQWGFDPAHIMPMLWSTAFWQWFGYHAVFLLAGMTGMDQSVLEAATVDGAGTWQRARYIIIPLLKPIFAFITITSALGALVMYDVPILLLNPGGVGQGYGSGPGGQGWFMLTYISFVAFDNFRFGYATAIGWLMFTLAVVITLFQLRLYNFGEID
ncbi:sugar ABC transporter permease [Chloroflexi bacterium TSY]|nr:sugar ABC transporter permease [Chloroflexi bacterium TSY]